ncbi:sulfatase-like hydrolase/transferase [Alienimonas sp. DA493]|uniref:sulfatase-like hydrolase/transferase n=1 Tax=Alienimonas sp. DA493 TaxID=3373605 RepID=UPI003753FDDF
MTKLLRGPLALIAAALWAVPGSPAAAGPPADGSPGRPNLLVIVADDLGYSDLGCYGGEIATPHLDRLAAGGVRFSQFYATPRCCPSRACLLTGREPHAVGLGHMTRDAGAPGYRGRLAPGALTAGDRLAAAGYRTFLAGKWHLGTPDPTRHGFEEFYGTLASAKTFWDPDHFRRLPAGRTPLRYEPGDFYATDAVVDHAVEFLSRADDTPGRPWFLYLALNAPHFPLQAPEEAIAEYADRYAAGWDRLRAERLGRMKALGVLPADAGLSPRGEYLDWAADELRPIPAWDDLPADRRADLARRMAIYAAMVTRLDAAVGRVLGQLEARGELNDTLVLFTSDNGACAEWDPFGFDGESGPDNNVLHTGDELAAMGSPGTFHSVGAGWANASNTPWRLAKHFAHEGGISVPLILAGPGVPDAGTVETAPAHLLDVLPTLLDAADAPADGLAGVSVRSLAAGGSAGEAAAERALFWEHEGNRAARRGRWKLTALRGEPWALFDLKTDRTETRDLSAAHPDRVAELAAAWDAWAAANDVTPAPADYGVAYLAGGDPAAAPVADVEAPADPADAAAAAAPPRAVGPVRKLAGGFRFTEGPAWDGAGTLYFSDLPNRTLHRWTEEGGVELLRTGAVFSNGIDVDRNGALAFCEASGRIVRRAVDGSEATLADRCGDQPLGLPNDLWIGPDGAVYFTLPRDRRGRGGAKPPPDGKLYATVCRIDPATGAVRDLDPDDVLVNGPNGIVGSADGKRLFLADPPGRACWAYDLGPDGALSNRRRIADRASDGLTVDERGNLYVTGKTDVLVYSPAGERIAAIPFPEQPANLTFGGPDGRTLFVTARTGLYAVDMNVRGDRPAVAVPPGPRPAHRPDPPGTVKNVPQRDTPE